MNNQEKKNANNGTGPHQVALDEWISCAPFEKLLNMDIVEAKEAKATLKMPFLFDYAQGAGLMHGGAIISLADTAVVMAIKSVLPPETHFATISAESKFLYPVKQGVVTARAEASVQENRIIKGSAIVFDENEKSVLEFQSIFKIAKHRQIKKKL
jgi:uncharacterized protein (TIGR00369 family)